ncbi:orotate phosphoribosyltransferase [Candidatus Bipolaricaulota bacterium]
MAKQDPWMDLLEAKGAILTGHFLLSSGRHSERYVQCAKALEHPKTASLLGQALAESFDMPIERVIAPPLGGLLIGYEVARHLDVPFSFPERGEDGALSFRRGFSLGAGERIAVIEDVITTGRTPRELLQLARQMEAQPIALGAIVDRSEAHHVGDLPICSLLRLEIPTFEAEACPLCQRGIPLRQPGSRDMNAQEAA